MRSHTNYRFTPSRALAQLCIERCKSLVPLLVIAMAITFTSSAYAQFSITTDNDGNDDSAAVAAYTPPGGYLVPASTGTRGIFNLTVSGNVTYTYLGSQAGWANTFTSGGNTFTNQNGSTPTTFYSSFTNYTAAGVFGFSFNTTNNTTGGVYNGGEYDNTNHPSFAISPTATVNGKTYQYILDYKDTYLGANDYNNMLIGVNYSAGAPEIDGSLAPKVGFLLGCLFLMFGRRTQSIATTDLLVKELA